jgi:hypothetical protein
MQYDITETTEKFDPDVLLPIWKDSLPDLDERRVSWGYEQTPQGRARLWYLNDTASRQPFGACVVLPRNFYHDGRKLRGGITADFAIKKEFRSLGPALGLQKAIAALQDFDTLIAFPNRNAVGVQLRAGFEDLGFLTVFRKIFRSRDLLKRRYNPVLSSVAAPIVDAAIKLKSVKLSRSALGNYTAVDALGEGFAELWDRVKSRFGFIGDRNTDYLRWRFLDHPYKSYAFFGLKETTSSKLIGYLAYYIKDNIAYIDDLLFDDPQAHLGALIEAFSAHCRESRLDAMSLIMLQSEKYASLLKGLDFLPEKTQQKVLLLYRDQGSVRDADVFVTMGDCDI